MSRLPRLNFADGVYHVTQIFGVRCDPEGTPTPLWHFGILSPASDRRLSRPPGEKKMPVSRVSPGFEQIANLLHVDFGLLLEASCFSTRDGPRSFSWARGAFSAA